MNFQAGGLNCGKADAYFLLPFVQHLYIPLSRVVPVL